MTTRTFKVHLASAIPDGQASAVVPTSVAYAFIERLNSKRETCAHGHEWTIATTRVRIRDRSKEGRGLVIERDCRVCKHQAYVEKRRHNRHQMKGGRLT